jgi:UDP-glucuronate decarboxylase
VGKFLVPHLCGRLPKDSSNVICVDNYFTGTRRNIDSIIDHHGFELIRHDVTFPRL